MDLERLKSRLDFIGEKLNEFGYDLREDLDDLMEQRPDIAELILNTKLKKIEYFHDEEQNFLGFLLANLHITFILEFDQDEDGEFYDVAECRVLDTNSGDEE